MHPNAEILLYRVRFAEIVQRNYLKCHSPLNKTKIQNKRVYNKYYVIFLYIVFWIKIDKKQSVWTLPVKSCEKKEQILKEPEDLKTAAALPTKFNSHFFYTRFRGHVL